jgi:hypothetical protein
MNTLMFQTPRIHSDTGAVTPMSPAKASALRPSSQPRLDLPRAHRLPGTEARFGWCGDGGAQLTLKCWATFVGRTEMFPTLVPRNRNDTHRTEIAGSFPHPDHRAALTSVTQSDPLPHGP